MTPSYVQIGAANLSSDLLAEVVVEQALNAHWSCRVVFRTTLDARPQVEAMQGQPLKISVLDGQGVEHVLFAGTVQRAAVKFEVWGSYGATLVGVSLCWPMSVAAKYAYFLKQPPQAIAAQLTGNSGVALAGSQLTGDANASRVQWAETDYDFLLQLADDAESWVRPSATGVEVQNAFQPGVTLVWREGETGLLEFSTSGRVHPQLLDGTHYDPNTMQSQSYSAVSSDATFYSEGSSEMVAAAVAQGKQIGSAEQGARHRALTLADFNTRLELESRRAAVNAVVCTGISRDQTVCAGDEVTLTGLPAGAGTYGVISCTHTWTAKGYQNHFVATPAKRWFAPVRPPRGKALGLVPARVAANHDPHNQGRLQISYPWLTGAPTTWARLLTPHAGADRGFLFYPEVGDEVAVRFEGADPERPVVMGSLWNGVQQPPAAGFWQPGTVNQTEFASNYIKRIATKSGLRITLNDTPGQESIHLATPHSNEVFMTEKANETGRPVIALHTTGDIHIHAPQGRIHSKTATQSRHTGDPQKVQKIVAHVKPKAGPKVPSKCAVARAADTKLSNDTAKTIKKQIGRKEPQNGIQAGDYSGPQARPSDWTPCQGRAADMGPVMRRFNRYRAALPGARAALNANQLGNKPGNQAGAMQCVTRLPDNAKALNAALGLKKSPITDEMLRDDKTGFRAAMYRDDSTGKVMLVARDTQPHSLVDWKTNTDNGAGRDTAQYRAMRELTKTLTKSKVSFDQAGYSKGGGLAQQAGILNPSGKTYLFNSAGIPDNLLKGFGPSSVQSFTANSSAFSSQGDFLTYLNNTTDSTQQLKNANWLEDQLSQAPAESHWYEPEGVRSKLNPIGIFYENPASESTPDPNFAKDKAAYLADLKAMIQKNTADVAQGKAIRIFPPVRAATQETIPDSMSSAVGMSGAGGPIHDDWRYGTQMTGKLYQHQMSVVEPAMEASVDNDRKALQSFVKDCG